MYRRVTYEDRLQMKAYFESGLTQSEVAHKLNFHRSTVSKEIKRNSIGHELYRPDAADYCARVRQDFYKRKPRKMTLELKERIRKKINLDWSPEEISNRLRFEGEQSVCTETIYKFIHVDKKAGGNLWRKLKYSKKRRWRRFAIGRKRGPIQNVIPISMRPKEIEQRKRCGDWERDTMVGKAHKGGVLVLTDRKSRFNLFAKLGERKSDLVTQQTKVLLNSYPVHTITNDRGFEFSDHKNLSNKIKTKIYFCDPYSAYQRGTNENRIGALRRYYPKRTDLRFISNKKLKAIQNKLNTRPMKCLDWKTPYEVMFNKCCATKW